MNGVKVFLIFIARLFISLIFILSAIDKMINWKETLTGVSDLFADWSSFVSGYEIWQSFFIQIAPWVPILVIVATAVELIFGLLLFFGIKSKLSSFMLIVFLVPTTILFHQFWYLEGLQRDLQTVMFLKNTAIIGALLYIIVFGANLKEIRSYFDTKEDMDNGQI